MTSVFHPAQKNKNLPLFFLLLALAGCTARPQTTVTFPVGRELTGASTIARLEDWQKVDPLREIVNPQAAAQEDEPGWQRILIALVVGGLGLLQMINPRLAWNMEQGWKYKNLKPSETYLIVSRIAGAGLILIGLWIFLRG
jgi:hypothetical protein